MASLKSIIRQGKQTRSDLKKLRNTGKVPAVVYGYGTKNTSVKVDEVEFIKVIREVGRNGVIDLGVGSKTIKVMVSDYQFDPLKNQITHIDFLAINMTEERTVEVPVQLVGEAVGAKEGGVVEQPLFVINSICLSSFKYFSAIMVALAEGDKPVTKIFWLPKTSSSSWNRLSF